MVCHFKSSACRSCSKMTGSKYKMLIRWYWSQVFPNIVIRWQDIIKHTVLELVIIIYCVIIEPFHAKIICLFSVFKLHQKSVEGLNHVCWNVAIQITRRYLCQTCADWSSHELIHMIKGSHELIHNTWPTDSMNWFTTHDQRISKTLPTMIKLTFWLQATRRINFKSYRSKILQSESELLLLKFLAKSGFAQA